MGEGIGVQVSDPEEFVGRSIHEIDTPVALLNLELFEQNARSISGFLFESGLAWRPHSKAHKSPRLAQLQRDLGAIGVTCAKVGEAEVMIAGGIASVLVANHLATPEKWQRVAALQASGEVIVCVDDPAHVAMGAAAGRAAGVDVPVLIEVDLGMDRVGTRSAAESVALAGLIADSDGMSLRGVMGYEGHVLTAWPLDVKRARATEAAELLVHHAESVQLAGHEVGIVSSGGSGSYRETAHVAGLTESQAGGGCLMCRFYAEACHVDLAPALSLVASVVSVRPPGLAIIDAGFKALGNVAGMGLPLVVGRSGVECVSLSAEHGRLALSDDAMPLRVGDRVHLIPAYSDAMLVNHDFMLGHRGETVSEVVAMPGRGQLR